MVRKNLRGPHGRFFQFLVGVGDYFGSNTSDILFRNSAGDTWFEAISNGAFAGWNQIGGSNPAYSVPNVLGPPSLK
jgi:hypothetical protein